MMNEILTKLDLNAFIDEFSSFFARKKPIFLEGDSKLHFRRIKELERLEFQPPPPCENLSQNLIHLSKQGILHLSESFEFIKILRYFSYLKGLKFEDSLQTWLDKITIPTKLLELCAYFDSKGQLQESLDERLLRLNEALKIKNEHIHAEFKKLTTSKALQDFLIDTQIHFINNVECLLVRGGYTIKAKIIARSSGGGFYVLPQNIENLQDECEKIRAEKEKIFYEYAQKISLIFHKELAFLKFIDKAFDTFDNYSARVQFARKKDYEFVRCDESKNIILKDFAHPALKNAKSVSLEFKKQVLLITGVNAGGKSMLLKGILSATFLAKHLLPMKINAHLSQIGSFKDIDAIIEDPQNVKNDISTFAGRMLAFSKLMNEKNLLLGIDEIELGTDFEEAASLYTVLIQTLVDKGLKIIITTHHKRLAMLLAKNEQVELVAALFDEERSCPRYEFLKGTVGKSYAFETALRYGISANLIARAKQIYGENKENLEELIGKNINLELELKERLKTTAHKEQKAQEILNALKNQKERNDEEVKKLISSLEFAYHQAIEEAKKSLHFKDTKEKQRSINKANELKKSITMPEFSQDEELKIGDFVKYKSIKGQIVSLNKNEAMVQSEGLKLRVALNLLKKDFEPVNVVQKSTVLLQSVQNASVSLDLHGLRSEEAIERLDKFISDALIAGFDELIVYHGIGTGKLAFAVKEFLQTHKSVKSFADAPARQGGFGAKIIKL